MVSGSTHARGDEKVEVCICPVRGAKCVRNLIGLRRPVNSVKGPQPSLLVEDETFVRDVACEILSAGGYHVRS
jgi:hypothetical protein